MAKVILEHVCKTYPGGVTAVNDANLEIEDQEFVVLVGPSGCGKSTTLRMVAGLEEISKGAIYIDGRKVNDVPPKDRDIAMVFQNYALYPHMTVYKNMAFGLKLRRYPRDEIDRRVREAADILGIQDLLERKPKALSGGQRQRVAVGRAIVRKPKAFLFDEPLSNLDAKMRVQMRAEISKLHTRLASTMIYVTHDQVEAMTMGDRIVVMKDGLIQQVATPLELYNRPANQFVAGFIGSPPMNFFPGTLEARAGGLFFQEGSFSVRTTDEQASALSARAGQPVVFGIRPEDVAEATGAVPAGERIAARVEVVEPMGAEVYVYLSTGKHSFVARVGPQSAVEVNQTVPLTLNMKQAHFFHPETGDALA
ncbi:MAG TPA: sn-glycerol-3-phosphate ABC transporter ATP-binding protein UgpC [Kiritimatiellia bacterium]|nr:sn-glycerol-3-phosphate ABC transporter ATP-binding protein UgpC [Kiritimatiellia bacterium]HRZ11196.1 sn-glycerol-3-phosphate ABC transporter ATP-binding protein UgpC [Kiritimatiellia bacterium]HSA19047.1 sn-glycerol-3-phosphate ABC transporter ATP-binding protein UgpC [Kiritimatiellia bacterium]